LTEIKQQRPNPKRTARGAITCAFIDLMQINAAPIALCPRAAISRTDVDDLSAIISSVYCLPSTLMRVRSCETLDA